MDRMEQISREWPTGDAGESLALLELLCRKAQDIIDLSRAEMSKQIRAVVYTRVLEKFGDDGNWVMEDVSTVADEILLARLESINKRDAEAWVKKAMDAAKQAEENYRKREQS